MWLLCVCVCWVCAGVVASTTLCCTGDMCVSCCHTGVMLYATAVLQ